MTALDDRDWRAFTRGPFFKTYLLVLVAALFVAYLYLVESRRPDSEDKPKEKVFSALKDTRAAVKEVTLARPAETIQLVKGSEGWRMVAPQSVKADQGEVDALLSSLESLDLDEVVAESPGDVAAYGLSPPQTTVTVVREGVPEALRLQLGGKTPDGNGLYARLPTSPRVFTVPAWSTSGFDKRPFDLRDRSLLHVKGDEVKTLEVTTPQETYALARDGKGEWVFTRPLSTRAGRWSVDGLLGVLAGLRMESVASEDARDLKPYGLDAPRYQVALGLADGTSRRLEIGGSPAEKQHHAREGSSKLVAVVSGAVVDDLAKGMKELRARRLLDVAAYEVEGFDVEAGGVKKTYVRSSTKGPDGVDVYKWKRTAPATADLDTNTVQDALFLVGGLEVQDFVDQPQPPAAYGLDAPALRVALRHEGGKPPLWFELGRKDGAAYARRTGDQAVLTLDPSKTDELTKAFSGL